MKTQFLPPTLKHGQGPCLEQPSETHGSPGFHLSVRPSQLLLLSSGMASGIDIVCLGGKAEDLEEQLPALKLLWAVAAPQLLGVSWLKRMQPLVGKLRQGEMHSRRQENQDVLFWSCLRSLSPFRNLEAPSALAMQMFQVLPFLPELPLGTAEAQGSGRGSV